MNKEQFYSTHPDERVDIINEMLKTRSYSEVAKEIGVPGSSFGKEMQRGDYVYIQRDNKFYKFIRDKTMVVSNNESATDNILSFIKDNQDILKKMISDYEYGNKMLILDERVYSNNAKFENKSIKMNNDIHKQFIEFCKKDYPFLTVQDLIAQSLLEFMEKYSK
ncbi:hypothetical protein SAMN05880501_10552 [Ureibacillus xyleni]|uniref:Uncharacterized protein n=1 Tax=Ureibacillus xyleni TaxID=614648 RepID=A0A285SKD1_9BACL|nr:hypothetical protein [Ureibacillus xyleni]SOC08278.1 hypothetical protein SAMN05880501_10552 [Ureibacillus xyleni]